MISEEKAFRYGATAVVIAILIVIGLSFLHKRDTDPVTQCIQDRLIEARTLRKQGHDEYDAGREDAGDRLIRRAFALENSMGPCLDLDESTDNPGENL